MPGLAPLLRKLAASAAPREACGFVTRTRQLVEVANRERDPNAAFDAGPLHEMEEREGEALAIWHTHPEDQPPSAQDVVQCAATFLPWVIAGPSQLWVIHPESRAYAGRDFVYGIEDCWTLVSDWHAQEAGIHMPWFDRPPDGWWRTAGTSPYVAHAEAFGFGLLPFREVGVENLRRGDVLLMQIAGRRVNHAAVYMGGGTILHHLYGHLSRPEMLDGRLQKATHYVGRHREMEDSAPC